MVDLGATLAAVALLHGPCSLRPAAKFGMRGEQKSECTKLDGKIGSGVLRSKSRARVAGWQAREAFCMVQWLVEAGTASTLSATELLEGTLSFHTTSCGTSSASSFAHVAVCVLLCPFLCAYKAGGGLCKACLSLVG